jgi:peroxiredoxin
MQELTEGVKAPDFTLSASGGQTASLHDMGGRRVILYDKFVAKYGLPFTLLADPGHEIAQAYGVWKQKSNYGKKYMGIERTTFLIDKDGTIQRIWRNVRANGHAKRVLEAIRA